MKTYHKLCLIAISALLCLSCEKERESLSTVTSPCELTLLGSETMLVSVGSEFVEPGYTATENETDLSSSVVVSGTMYKDIPGRYTLRYTVKNSNGAITVAKRTVIVFDPATPTGFYKVSSESYRNAPPSSEYRSEPTILIYQEESGAYFVSDLFGGFYDVGRGYGARYATGGSVKINKTGIVSLVASRTTPWGDKFSKVDGTYDAAAQIFNISVVWEAGYTFYLKFVKQ